MTKIAFLSLCAALLLAACDRNRHTPAPEPQQVPISFSALSQDPVVKADGGTTPLSDYHRNFGIWGIARHSLYAPYILWETSAQPPMERVQAVPETDENGEEYYTSNFAPVSGAYWIQGYTYSFIAIAPYPSDSAFSDLAVSPAADDDTHDSFSFTIDMGKKYAPTSPDYDFDPMGAAARSNEVTVASKQGAQSLNFHHLLAKININIQLKDSQAGSQLVTVSKVKLQGLNTCMKYTLSLSEETDQQVFTIGTTVPTPDPEAELVIDKDASKTEAGFQQSLNVVPQSISDFKMYIDFTLETGTDPIAFTDFFVDIANAPNQPATKLYERNQVYNWNITIGSKEDISFTITVTRWGEQQVGDEIEIY